MTGSYLSLVCKLMLAIVCKSVLASSARWVCHLPAGTNWQTPLLSGTSDCRRGCEKNRSAPA
eukprot:2987256-Amphidinium_carterae.1